MPVLAGALCVLGLTIILTFLVRHLARKWGIVARPRKDRWHRKPTALLGGVAIYAAFVAGFFLFAPRSTEGYVILGAGTLLFITGLVDDFFQIKPYMKLVMQLIAAAMVVYCDVRLPWTSYQAVNDLITIFWLVGITNAINLLDNMDGLAGGISVISCLFLAVSLLINGQSAEAMLPAMLGAAALGFLAFNFNPASIFMGDCGSMFLGFTLGGMALMSEYGRTRSLTAVLLTPVLILMIPIFDTCVVTCARKLSGRRVSQGGRDHTSHRLVALGMTERRAVLMLYFFAAMSGTLALLVGLINEDIALMVVPGFALSILFFGLYIGKVRVYEEGEEPSNNSIVRLITDFSYKRRVFEVLLDVVLVALAYYGAYLLRFDGNMPQDQTEIFLRTLPLIILFEMLCFLGGGVYRGLWRYAGVQDLIAIAKAVVIGATLGALVALYIYGFVGPSRAVFVLNALLLFVFIGASRLSFRVLRVVIPNRASLNPNARPVLIYGAGDSGELLVREILNNPDHQFLPVGFIDDDLRKIGKLIHGCRIFESSKLPDLIERYKVSDVLVSSVQVPEHSLNSLRSMGVSLRRMSIRIE